MRGKVPSSQASPSNFDRFLLPGSEYVAYVRWALRERAQRQCDGDLVRLFGSVAAASQPARLTLAATVQPRLAELRFGIPVTIVHLPSEGAFDMAWLQVRVPLSSEAASFVATAIREKGPALSCGAKNNSTVLDHLRANGIVTQILDHECNVRSDDEI